MKRKLIAVCLCFLFVLTIYGLAACTTQNSSSSGYEKTVATARTEIWKSITAGGASSAAVAISVDGKMVYTEGFAMADRAKATPVDVNTQYNIGSVSKMFVTMAVLQLCQEGKLNLDQPVSRYLSEFTMKDPRYQQITVRMLLNHTSELDGTYSYDTSTSAPDSNFMGYFLDNLSQSSLKGDPGIISIYCNDGFTLAQALVEKVSGMSFSDYLNKNILPKASMNNTSCYLKEANQNVALYYQADGTAADREYLNSLGAGGIASTAEDLCKFGNAILAGKIVDKQYVDESFTAQYGSQTIPSGTPQMSFGLGWDSVNDEEYNTLGVRLIFKGGDTSEYHSMLYLFPDQNITIALTFSGPADTTEVTNAIAKTLLEEKGFIQASSAEIAKNPTPSAIPDRFMGYTGYYSVAGNILKIDFNQAAGEMNIYSNSDTGFLLVETDKYMDDGYFYGANKRYTLEENFGTKFLLYHSLTGKNKTVNATMIPSLSSTVSPAQFVGKQWITINTLPIDTIFLAGSTWVMDQFPGYVLFGGNGYYLLNQLIDEKTSVPNLKYTRDTMEFKLIDEQGQTMLQVGGFKLANTADVPTLQAGEKITIGTLNVSRKLPVDGFIKAENGRIVVVSPSLTTVYDSLTNGSGGTAVTAGSYVVFIGNEGDTIAYDYQV